MYNRVLILNVCLLFSILQESTGNDTIEVNLKQGVLSGKVKTTLIKKQDYYSFEGVPYAAPPIGELRFKPPTFHTGWEGTYKAHKTKRTCLQFNTRSRLGEKIGISGSEDCLYLNIFTPSLEGSKSVVIFEYNDNFKTGFNGTKTYSPEFFIDEDVIVVTINHRLGLMGYLTTEDEVIPGNNGLRDFIFGLKWIQDNIGNFGGDPNRITLMGSRGGAVMANILLYVKQAKNLFSTVILQSGSAMESLFFHTQPKKLTFKLAESVNITAEDSKTLLEEFQKIDVNILLEKSNLLQTEPVKTNQMNVIPFALTIEPEIPDALITSLPENNIIINDVPVLIGFNSRDGIDLAFNYMTNPRGITEDEDPFLVNFPVRPGYRFDSSSSIFEDAINEIKQFYLSDGYLHYNNILDYAVYLGDTVQIYAGNYAAKKLANDLDSPVFYYMFDVFGMLNENSIFITRYALVAPSNWGATITDEICYLHLCSRIRRNYASLVKLLTEQDEIKVLKKMVRMWTNFAKTGNPTPTKEDNILKGLIWAPIAKGNDDINYLHIEKKRIKMKVNPLGEREAFWNNFLAKYSEMAVDGVVTSINPRDEL